jgi:hypothetical protein
MKTPQVIATLAATVVLGACNSNGTLIGTGEFRVVNGVTTSTSMNVDLASVGSAGGIIYGDASGKVVVPQGSYDATIKPTGTSAQNYKVTGVPITGDTITTVLTYGSPGSASGFKAPQQIDTPAAGTLAVEFLHDAKAESAIAPNLNFYMVAAGAGPAGALATTVAFAVPPTNTRVSIPVSATGYELIVKDAATGTIVFDSGATAVNLHDANANVLQIVAVDKDPASSKVSPVQIVVMDNEGNHFLVTPAI